MLPSDQPRRIRLTKKEKKIFRALYLDTYLGTAAWTFMGLPKLTYNYLTLEPKTKKIRRGAIGIFVDPAKNDTSTILTALQDLNISSVGLRIYVNSKFLDSEAYRRHVEMAKTLHQKGYKLLLVLAQTFESFDGALEKNLTRVLRDFAPFVEDYQIGEAVNRSKWGVQDSAHYTTLIDDAFDTIHRFDPTAKTVGPSVIDFEWFYTLYYNHLAKDRFDVANALLYVDRVREPENEQHGFDTEAKIRLFKAIAPEKPLWITEVNWPLKNQGAYKPTSNKEAVSEAHYRDYMARYLVMALSDGYVDRVYWWQLLAKGYGLIDHLDLRRRPAFRAFGTLVKTLEGSVPEGKSREGGLYDYRFAKGDKRFHVFWTRDGRSRPIAGAFRCIDLNGTVVPTRKTSPTPIICEEKP